jgi:hypothetical protein
MSQSRQMKAREYGTDVLNSNFEQGQDTSRTRQNNTFKSSILATQEFPESPRRTTREKYHPTNRPLISSVTRTSF